MSLPVYFVQPPSLPPPPGKCALCGWFAAQDGTLTAPPEPESADCLVFDDRKSLPQQFEPLLKALLTAREEIKAQYIILDFERQPSPISLSFVKRLSGLCPVAAPEVYCNACDAEPLLCYCPATETFDAFRQRIPRINAWLELRPVDELISYPLPGVQPSDATPGFFSDVLQCHYKAQSSCDGPCLHLYDTQESLLHRAQILVPQLKAVIGLRNELNDFAISGSIQDISV
ncbi:MAG: hypothetical protein E7464_07320 [Ruminococcaceae bacterium]|nr:hypothetical protein [Oscillospiraceae bacterium]